MFKYTGGQTQVRVYIENHKDLIPPKRLLVDQTGNRGRRYQHSDSAMGHILPQLGTLDLNGVNFGPTFLVPEIRKYLPHARITFMRNDREQLLAETLRDIQDGFAYGGVNINTACSINNGSALESMRYMMEIIQNNRK